MFYYNLFDWDEMYGWRTGWSEDLIEARCPTDKEDTVKDEPTVQGASKKGNR